VHEVVFYAAALWMTGLLVVSVVLVIRAQHSLARILALDMTILILVALLVLYSDSQRVAFFLDAALMLALLSVIATIAAARYHSEGRLFS
jgi:multicomponent Na+:H+ antiporter subunit F